MALASFVACSMSLEAPVVMEWNMNSSAGAASGEGGDLILMASSLLIKNRSPGLHLHGVAQSAAGPGE